MRRSWFDLGRRGLAAAITVCLSGCDEEPVEPVVVGVALTASTHAAIELAAQEINAGGGIGGRALELAGREWRFGARPDPREVLAWAQRFAQIEGLVGVIGHSDSSSTLSAAAVYNQHEIPLVVTIATHPAITDIGEWVYRLCLSDAQQGPALARFAVREWGKRTIGVVHVNDDYGRGLAETFEGEARRLGATVAATLYHRGGLADEDERRLLRRQLASLAGRPELDLVALFQRVEEAEWTIRVMREEGLSVDVLGGENLSRTVFLDRDVELKEGLRMSQFFVADRDDAATQRFVRDYRAFAGREPDYGDAYAYDALYLLRLALEEGGPRRRAIKAFLDRSIAERRTIEGVAGPYRLAEDHDARRPLAIVEIRGGRFHPLREVVFE